MGAYERYSTHTLPTVRKIAERLEERIKALGLKGTRRENECLSYFVGATTAIEQLGDEYKPLAQHMERICTLVIAIRGYDGLKKHLAEE